MLGDTRAFSSFAVDDLERVATVVGGYRAAAASARDCGRISRS
jgi:hypothetical protein